jgi:energy-coupling factor transporter ATP-binding protein EcfA2
LKKVKELQLHNFKFFTEKDNTLNIGGKNLLIWGENGSGKSSIYWSIYTLLQCSFKDKKGIDDYFTFNGEKNLLNIHAPDKAPSFVRMKLDDEVEYKIALNDYSVINNKEIQFGAVSSDFIDYRVLLNFLSFYHRDKPLLFNYFAEDIFRYLPFKPPAPFKYAYFDNAWQTVEKGLKKIKGARKYPSTGSTTYKNYNALVVEFNKQLKDLLGQVTVRANKILDKEFGYDIEIELAYTAFSFTPNSSNTKIQYSPPEIELKVNKYYGKEDVVKKPHSFLNEAKKTAIGLAVRLGILERRMLDDTKLNLLALDDLLISLDMSNREVVLNLLFKDYQKNYQLILFTHDKQFFHTAKHKLEHSPEKANWHFWEYYVDERDEKKLKPRLFENETELSTAHNHLLNNDYPAAANYLRKHCEKIIEEYLPESCYADPEKKESGKNHSLDAVLIKSGKFLTSINQTAAVNKIHEVQRFVKMLLNPLSHTERGVERYKGEIKRVVFLLEELEELLKPIKKKFILPTETELTLTLIKSATITYKIRLKIKDDLYVYDDNGVLKLSKCNTDSLAYEEIESGTEKSAGNFKYFPNTELEQSYNSISTYTSISIPVIADWQTLISSDNGTTLRQQMVI